MLQFVIKYRGSTEFLGSSTPLLQKLVLGREMNKMLHSNFQILVLGKCLTLKIAGIHVVCAFSIKQN